MTLQALFQGVSCWILLIRERGPGTHGWVIEGLTTGVSGLGVLLVGPTICLALQVSCAWCSLESARIGVWGHTRVASCGSRGASSSGAVFKAFAVPVPSAAVWDGDGCAVAAGGTVGLGMARRLP